MDTSKMMIAVCGLILLVCLTLCITTLSVLRNAVAENQTVKEQAESLVGELDACVDALNSAVNEVENVPREDTPVDATVSGNCFLVKTVNQTIAVYTEDGALIHCLKKAPATLPKLEREALASGIRVESLQALLELIQAYES